jgi:hypothetical protein
MEPALHCPQPVETGGGNELRKRTAKRITSLCPLFFFPQLDVAEMAIKLPFTRTGSYEGRKQVRIQLKNGADFIKIYAAGIRANPDIGYGARQ